MPSYQLSAFADEITPHFEDQLKSLASLGIHHIPLRLVDDKNIIDYSINEVKKTIKPLLDQYKIQVSSIGSPIGKVDIHNADDVHNQFDKMENLVQICQLLDVRYIRMFSYYNTTEQDKPLVLEYLNKLLSYTKDTNIILLHENEKDIFGDTAEKCLYLANSLNKDHFKLIFDPANFVQVGDHPLHAFDILKDHIIYLHLKDARYEDSANVLIGRGDGELETIIHSCIQKGDVKFMTFEPHLVAFTGLSLLEHGEVNERKTIRTPYQAFEDSLEAFKAMVHK